MVNNEQWREVQGYEGLYEVSNLGNVRSLDRWVKRRGIQFQKGQKLKLLLDKKGYLHIVLSKEGKIKRAQVHRLVAQAFIPNPDNLPQVNHKDENPANNCVDNLEWCDSKYNNNYGTHTERVAKGHSKPVAQYSKDGILIQVYCSAREAEKQTNVWEQNIAKCCKGKLKSTGGFIWKYN